MMIGRRGTGTGGRMHRRRLPALLAALLVVLACIGAPFAPRIAYAHASLIRANPANNETLRRPPARIVLNFSEAIEQRLTQIQVADNNKNRVDDGPIAFDDRDPTFASIGVKTLAPGLYFVKWSNVSTVDGHPYNGQYPFIVLNPDGTFPAGVSLQSAGTASTGGGGLLPYKIDIALKWIALLSLAIVAGAAFFLIAVLRPAARFLEDEEFLRTTDASERWVVNLSHVLLPASFIAGALLVLLTVDRFATDTSLWEYIAHLRPGQYRAGQLVLLVIALLGADLLFLGGSDRKRNAGIAVLLFASVAALFMYSMTSHSATGRGEFWAVSSDFVHLFASSTWLGALVLLVPLLRWARRELDDTQRFLYLANAFDRFSIIAGISVIAVLASGTFNALVEVPNASAMIDTTYGKVLLAKIILILPLLAIAGLNAFYLKPRLVAVIDGLYQQGGTGTEQQRSTWMQQLSALQRWLPKTILLEIFLVLAVFASVAVLSQSSTAKGEIAQDRASSAAPAKFDQIADANGVKLSLEVSPDRVGLNQYTLLIQNADGTPLDTVTQARLRFSFDDVQNAVAPSEIILNKFAPGDFRGAGSYFTEPGNWRADANVRRSSGDDVTHAFVLPVARAAATPTAGGSSIFELPFTALNWNEVAGAILALLGAAILIYRRQLHILRPPAYRVGVTIATALLLAGAVLAFGVHSDSKPVDARVGNPVPSSPASIDRGKMLFQQNCVTCHGIDGRGDGPASVNLSPAPSDFRLHIPLHTDPQFYAFIAAGYPGSAMPSFKDSFSDTDIWNLVNFLRSAFTEAPTQ